MYWVQEPKEERRRPQSERRRRRGRGGIFGASAVAATDGVGAVGGAVVATAVGGGDGCRARSRAKGGHAVVMAVTVGKRGVAKSGSRGEDVNHREDRQEQPGHQRVENIVL